MAESTGTLQKIGGEFAQIFQPVRQRIDADEILLLLAELGIRFPDSLKTDPAFTSSVTALLHHVESIPGLLQQIVEAIQAENWTLTAAKTQEMGQAIRDVITAIDGLKSTLEGLDFTADGISVGELSNFVSGFVNALVDYLLIQYIESYSPEALAFLEFFGIAERTERNVGSVDPLFPEFTERKLYVNRFMELFKSPAGLAKTLYGWGLPSFDGVTLLEKLNQILVSAGFPVAYISSPGPALDFFMFTLSPYTGVPPGELPGLQVLIQDKITPGSAYTFAKDNWQIGFELSSEIAANAILKIQPGGKFTFTNGLTADAGAKVTFAYEAGDSPLVLIGEPGASRLEIGSIASMAGITLAYDGSKAEGIFVAQGDIKSGKIVIKPSNPDGFLAKILPPEGVTLDFHIALGVNSEKGFYFRGSGTLEFDIPTNVSIGPLTVLNLTVGISPGTESVVKLGADVRIKLGPFTGMIENMGMKASLAFPPARNGNLGPLDLLIGFKPPTGIGLSLDAGVIRGGGYLMLDFDKGQYAGAIELTFQELFSFSGIGIITTKFPDGSKGFSLLVLINVTFGTPIAIGLNFYLQGIGGMIGLHRTLVTMALQQRVKDGSISNILFPENVIANITRIISDLEALFPAKQDQFVLGVMARLTWNTPAILVIDAGLVVEFPNPTKIAILGIVKCALPNPDEAILKLNVAFAGIIDFENKILLFDASIFDSRILTITLEGDIALRISWGDQPDFLLSAGGFHPVYSPAPHLQLRQMKRITVNILSGNPSLVLSAYFAVTSNTIQFGAALDFSFRTSGFGIYGHFGFDVLFQFSPFRFIAAVGASVAVKSGSSTLFAIQLKFNLEGPTPWRAYGYGSFGIWFITIKVRFDKTWGERRENSLPATAVLPLLLQELQKDTNWTTRSSALAELVTLSNTATNDDAILVKPHGSLEISQTAVPLDLTMNRFGNYKPDDISRATIKALTIAGETLDEVEVDDVKNSFAPAAYKEMSDQDKLQSPSYEKQNSGIRVISTDDIVFDYGINRLVEYECILSDYEEEELDDTTVDAGFFKAFVSGGDVGRSPLSKLIKDNKVKANKTVALDNEKYAVVSSVDLRNVHGENEVFNSKAEADDYLKEMLKINPSKKGKIQLSPVFQMVEV
jgi:hypothetical protein